jgi:hypothetical protein
MSSILHTANYRFSVARLRVSRLDAGRPRGGEADVTRRRRPAVFRFDDTARGYPFAPGAAANCLVMKLVISFASAVAGGGNLFVCTMTI